MKYLILAAGYGTRLERDVRNDTSGRFQHLVGVPKPLVPLAGKALITYWVEAMRACGVDVSADAYVVTNHASYPLFAQWAAAVGVAAHNIIDDGSTCNDNRLGAIRDIALVCDTKHITADDLCIVGGDTLFLSSFSLAEVVAEFQQHTAPKLDGLVLWYPCQDSETTQRGILLLDERQLVRTFYEKPQPHETPSRVACPCFYIFSPSALALLQQYVREHAACLKMLDAPGMLMPSLCTRANIFAFRIAGRFDIGNIRTFCEADDYFRAHVTADGDFTLMGPNKKRLPPPEPATCVSSVPVLTSSS